MKRLIFSLPLCLGLLTGTATLAADLKGPEIHSALSGKTYSCNGGGNRFTISFAKVASKSGEFPYTFNDGSRKVEDAYVTAKNGKLKQKSTNKGRAVAYDKKGRLVMKRSDGPSAKCTLK